MNAFQMCAVCSDIKHAKMMQNDAERIAREISFLVRTPKECPYGTTKYDTRFDCMHPHFRCGHCPQFSLVALKNAEDTIHLLTTALAASISKGGGEIQTARQVQEYLRGYYPGIYHVLDSAIGEGSRVK